VDGHAYPFRVRARDRKGNLSAWNVVSGSITSWQSARYVRADGWVAASGTGAANLVPIPRRTARPSPPRSAA